MCGIAGMMTLDGSVPPRDILNRLEEGIAHRGPDGRGEFIQDGMALLHRRLAIIDLESGAQPIQSAESALAFNGEIYNYIELREQIKDYPWQTQSDSEPLLYYYDNYGIQGFEYLRGMFALAIYDKSNQRLILARDSFGIKPLYYYQGKLGFAFASEAQALIKSELVSPQVNDEARNQLLAFQYSHNPMIFSHIHRLKPGEVLIIEKGRIKERHQLPPPLRSSRLNIPSQVKGMELLNDYIQHAVKIHLRSDVPYGLFLSGGIDSAALLSVMHEITDGKVETFTAGFSGINSQNKSGYKHGHDERQKAEILAEKYAANHHSIDVTKEDFFSYLPQVILASDDPVADYAAIPVWLLARKAREQNIKVVLSGEGGDEFFAGYGRYHEAMGLPLRFWRQKWPRNIFNKKFIKDMNFFNANFNFQSGFQIDEQAFPTQWSKLQKVQARDIHTWLPNDLLLKLDRMLMAHGIEGRTPFVDVELSALGFALADHLKVQKISIMDRIRGKKPLGKFMLRQWLNQRMPEAQPLADKQGFSVPVDQWLNAEMTQLQEHMLKQECLRVFCNQNGLKEIFSPHKNKKNVTQIQWHLLYYALWHKIHIAQIPIEGQDVLSLLSIKN